MKEAKKTQLEKLLDAVLEEEGKCPTCNSEDIYLLYDGSICFACIECDEQWAVADDDEADGNEADSLPNEQVEEIDEVEA